MKKIVLGVLVSVVMSGQAAQAITLSVVDSGVFDLFSVRGTGGGTSISHTSSNTSIEFSFFSSPFGGFTSTDNSAFAIFDLSGLTGSVTSASLEMSVTSSDFSNIFFPGSPGDPGSYVFNQVSSNPALFNSSYSESSLCCGGNPLGTGFGLYRALGNGPALGTVSYTGVGSQTVALGASGIDLIDLALGGLLVIGIDDAGGHGPIGDVTFATPQLTLELAPVPAPTAIWLFGSALLGLGAMKRKKT